MMKFLKIALIALVMLVNLVIASPSLADPNYEKNPDYIDVTNALEELQTLADTQKDAQGKLPQDLQRQIDELLFQKTAIESGVAWGQCRNESGENLAIYGPKGEDSESSYEQDIYFLANGQTTPEGWDCAGVYLPNDVQVAGLDKEGAVAIKITDGTQLIITKNSQTSELEFNVAPGKIVDAEEMNWFVPNVSQAFVDSRIPSTLVSGGGDNG